MPLAERPFKNTGDEFFNQKQSEGSLRETRLLNLSTKKKSLMLAGTMTLNQRQKSPQTRIRERNGFVTATMVPDVSLDKQRLARKNMNDVVNGVKIPKVDEYVVPKDYQFRKDTELDFG